MSIKFEAVICLEYDLKDGMTIEELTDEVIDQIKTGEYFPSRVKNVQVAPMDKAC